MTISKEKIPYRHAEQLQNQIEKSYALSNMTIMGVSKYIIIKKINKDR